MSTSSLLRSSQGQAAFHAAYHACLARWPVPHESLFVDTAQGRTHVVVSGPAAAPPLVLLHGATFTATQWVPNVEALSRAHRVYAVETVGDFGRSDAAHPLRSREEAEAWLGQVLDGLGLGQVLLGGHSLGAWMALTFAARHPERVQGLVLLGPAGGILAARAQFALHLFPLKVLPLRRMVDNALQWMHAPGNTPDPFMAALFRVCLRQGRPQFHLNPLALTEGELRELRVPTLLLVGEHDVVCNPRKAVSRALSLLPDVQAELVPGASHMLASEQAAHVNARVLAFLERVQSGAPASPVTRSA